MRTVFASLVAMVCLITGAGVAGAHSELLGSEPAADSQLSASPTQVTLSFNQTIDQNFAFLGVTSDDGRQWAMSEPMVNGQEASVGLVSALPPGRYTVAYRVVSQDGHPIQGTYVFALASGVATTTADPTPPSALAALPPDDAEAEPSRQSSGSASIWILATAGAAMLLAGAYSIKSRWWAKSDPSDRPE